LSKLLLYSVERLKLKINLYVYIFVIRSYNYSKNILSPRSEYAINYI